MKADNLLLHAAAWDAPGLLPSGRELDFVYVDPPYGVGTEMTARTGMGERRGRKQEGSGPVAYDDSQPIDALVAMIARAAAALRERLAKGATFAVHLDHRAVHEAKVALDAVFGRGAFIGEIIWVPGNGARGRGLSMTHQTILLFARSPSDRKLVRWNSELPQLREPFARTSLDMHFTNVDADGRRFRERIVAGKSYKYYADVGRKLGTVWSDISAMRANTPLNKEGTGYPTQKPEALLERLILATTTEHGTVGDFMCGSGTTLVVAARLGRCFIGGDVAELAIETTQRRLEAQGASFRLLAQKMAAASPSGEA